MTDVGCMGKGPPKCKYGYLDNLSLYIYIYWAYGVVVSMFSFHSSDRGGGGRIPVEGVKFHNDYHKARLRHHWQVSENHMSRVDAASHVREIGMAELAQFYKLS